MIILQTNLLRTNFSPPLLGSQSVCSNVSHNTLPAWLIYMFVSNILMWRALLHINSMSMQWRTMAACIRSELRLGNSQSLLVLLFNYSPANGTYNVNWAVNWNPILIFTILNVSDYFKRMVECLEMGWWFLSVLFIRMRN